MSMTMNDIDALNRAHDGAVKEMTRCATAIAEAVAEGETPTEAEIKAYKVSKLGVESTRRDLEYCMSLALAEVMDR